MLNLIEKCGISFEKETLEIAKEIGFEAPAQEILRLFFKKITWSMDNMPTVPKN